MTDSPFIITVCYNSVSADEVPLAVTGTIFEVRALIGSLIDSPIINTEDTVALKFDRIVF
jgi:hypothetical protein